MRTKVSINHKLNVLDTLISKDIKNNSTLLNDVYDNKLINSNNRTKIEPSPVTIANVKRNGDMSFKTILRTYGLLHKQNN